MVSLALAAGGCRRPSSDAPRPDPAEAASAPVASAGAMVLAAEQVAQRLVELHLGSLQGPVVARAHPGARLTVVAGEGDVVVTLPDHKDWSQHEVTLHAERGGFGATPVPLVRPVKHAGRLVRDMPPVPLDPSMSSPWSAFAMTLWGDVRMVEQVGKRVHIWQVHRGVEVEGWTDQAWPDDMRRGPGNRTMRAVRRQGDGRLVLTTGPTENDTEEVASVPAGFVSTEPGTERPLARALATGQTVHWLMIDTKQRAACRVWKFHKPDREGYGLLRLATPIVFELDDGFVSRKQRGHASFLVEQREGPDTITLLGPRFSVRPPVSPSSPAEGGYKCGQSYTFVGMSVDALRVFHDGPEKGMVAWHPDDEERWYTTAASCDEAAQQANAVLDRDPEALPPGGIHHDCYAELAQ